MSSASPSDATAASLSPTARRFARHLQAAADALREGDLGRAEQYLALLAEIRPDDPEFLRLSAIACDLRGESPEAIEVMQRALALRVDDAVYQNTMATVLTHAGRLDEAAEALQRACALQPDLAVAWYNLGIVLARAGRGDEAVDVFQRAAELDPGHPAIRVQLAEALRNRGQVAAAAAEYRRIVGGAPWAGLAWQGLADLKTIPLAEGDLDRMRAALAAPQATPADRIALGYAMARALEDAKLYADALAALERAKALARQWQTWDAAAFSRNVTEVTGAFTHVPSGADVEALGHEVIFIVGMPRSGTTLVEQILASHPQVRGAGELTDLKGVLLAESQRRNASFPDWVHAATPGDWERLGRRYLERTAAWRRRQPISTDKLPSNWLFVGAIMAMLPGARVICCRRDPLETCFACYRQYRAQLDYAGTFADLAAFWRDYDHAVRLWRTAFPDRVFEHRHEALLADQEGVTRRLLDFCGLPWDPACLEFHANARVVYTPSATQVREPLQARVPRAERYGKLLDPLRAALHLPPFVAAT
ncbi:MAG TPA: sulfotransferase [Rhodanobacteraceae bacterium]|nr:sulfotransferase [Rhodanobacteraceae bacterium]